MNGSSRLARRRLVSKVILGVFFLGVALTVFFSLAGLATPSTFLYLGLAGGFALLACLLWEVVARREEQGGFLAWACFPLTVLFAFAQVPPLALAVYPPLGDFLFQAGRARAWIVSETDGPRLEIWFPHPVDSERGDHNFLVDGDPLPEGYYEAHDGNFRWRNDQTLSVALDPLLRALGKKSLESITLNGDLASVRFHYTSDLPVPPQEVEVGAP